MRCLSAAKGDKLDGRKVKGGKSMRRERLEGRQAWGETGLRGGRLEGRNTGGEKGLKEEEHEGHQHIWQHSTKPSFFKLNLDKKQTCHGGRGLIVSTA